MPTKKWSTKLKLISKALLFLSVLSLIWFLLSPYVIHIVFNLLIGGTLELCPLTDPLTFSLACRHSTDANCIDYYMVEINRILAAWGFAIITTLFLLTQILSGLSKFREAGNKLDALYVPIIAILLIILLVSIFGDFSDNCATVWQELGKNEFYGAY